MIHSMRFLLPLLLFPSVSSIRLNEMTRQAEDVSHQELEAACPANTNELLGRRKGPLPAAEEYVYNSSKYRKCPAARDKIWMLQALLLPKYKLAFCYVPKVACTQFKDLFNFINKRWGIFQGFGRGYGQSMGKQLHVSMDTVTRENGWKFAAFTRDPVERYVSAFGSTCVPTDWGFYEHDFACCGDLVSYSNKTNRANLTHALKERVRADLKRGLPENEDHWIPTVDVLRNCGWDKFKPSNLDYWGTLSGDVHSQVTEMMSMVNYTNQTVIKKYFPPSTKKGHQNPMHGGAEDFAVDQETVRGIMKIYKDDYKLIPGIGCSFTHSVLERFSNSSQN